MTRDWGTSRSFDIEHTEPDKMLSTPTFCDSKKFEGIIDAYKWIRTTSGTEKVYDRYTTILYLAKKYSSLKDILHSHNHSGKYDLILRKTHTIDKYCTIDPITATEYVCVDVKEHIERETRRIKSTFEDRGILVYPQILNSYRGEHYVTEAWRTQAQAENIKKDLATFGKLKNDVIFEHKNPAERTALRCLGLRHVIWQVANFYNGTALGRVIKSRILGPLDLLLIHFLLHLEPIPEGTPFYIMGTITRKEIEIMCDLKEIMTQYQINDYRVALSKVSSLLGKAKQTAHIQCNNAFEKIQLQVIRLLPDDYRRYAQHISEEILEKLKACVPAYQCFQFN